MIGVAPGGEMPIHDELTKFRSSNIQCVSKPRRTEIHRPHGRQSIARSANTTASNSIGPLSKQPTRVSFDFGIPQMIAGS
jgi:hypothetical protein